MNLNAGSGPSFSQKLKAPDSRLVLTQLKARGNSYPAVGASFRMDGVLYNSAAQPMDARHVVVVILVASDIDAMLDQVSRRRHLHVFIYDAERHPIFCERGSLFASAQETCGNAGTRRERRKVRHRFLKPESGMAVDGDLSCDPDAGMGGVPVRTCSGGLSSVLILHAESRLPFVGSQGCPGKRRTICAASA